MANEKLLRIYLNDHLAGAVVGCELAERTLANNSETLYEPFLKELSDQLAEDRVSLEALMEALDISKDVVKQAFGWTAEKLGRLKFNGQLVGYSPLSRLVEFEGLSIGIAGKLSMWRNLKAVGNSDPRLAVTDFDILIKRAEAQLEEVERHRAKASVEAFA
jgi:hypothetical protein